MKGRELLGLSYTPLFDYYYTSPEIKKEYHSEVHHVMHADFVTADTGTGIAHEAPAFGEDDYSFVTSLVATSDEKNASKYLFPADKAKDWLFSPVDDH